MVDRELQPDGPPPACNFLEGLNCCVSSFWRHPFQASISREEMEEACSLLMRN